VRGDWYCDTYDRSRDGERTFRVDRIRAATPADVRFERRSDLVERAGAGEVSGRSGTASVWFSPRIARWEVEGRPDTGPLADGAAVASVPYGSQRWLATELCRYLGEAVLLDPHELRGVVARRAHALLQLVREHVAAHR
jgi:predicted DNA-binding transcriptional regulator YafY